MNLPNRLIALAECDEVCRRLEAGGFSLLAAKVSVTVRAHERDCVARGGVSAAPTRARFMPATVVEHRALTTVLKAVRADWSAAAGAATSARVA